MKLLKKLLITIIFTLIALPLTSAKTQTYTYEEITTPSGVADIQAAIKVYDEKGTDVSNKVEAISEDTTAEFFGEYQAEYGCILLNKEKLSKITKVCINDVWYDLKVKGSTTSEDSKNNNTNPTTDDNKKDNTDKKTDEGTKKPVDNPKTGIETHIISFTLTIMISVASILYLRKNKLFSQIK